MNYRLENLDVNKRLATTPSSTTKQFLMGGLSAVKSDLDMNCKQGAMSPSSPALPVARGGYSINWDEIDENTNPFAITGSNGTSLGARNTFGFDAFAENSKPTKLQRSPMASPKPKIKNVKSATSTKKSASKIETKTEDDDKINSEQNAIKMDKAELKLVYVLRFYFVCTKAIMLLAEQLFFFT